MPRHREALAFPALVLFQIRQLARTSFFLQTALAAPASFVLLRALAQFGQLGAGASSLWFDGSVAGLWATTTTATGILGYQRFLGTFEYLMASSLRPSIVHGSLVAGAALLGLLGIPVAVALQIATGHGFDPSAAQVLGLAVSLVACVASAHVLAALFLATRHATAFEPLLLIPVWLLVGVVAPADVLPGPVAAVALVHPLATAVRAAHASSLGSAFAWAGVSVAVSLVWLVAGSRALSRAQFLAASTGSGSKS